LGCLCIKISKIKEPYILLADHVEKKDLMLIYQVNNLDKIFSDLKSIGWIEVKRLKISWQNRTASFKNIVSIGIERMRTEVKICDRYLSTCPGYLLCCLPDTF